MDNVVGCYTYEELISMSTGELWKLFVLCGLVVDDGLGRLEKDKLALLVQVTFRFIHRGRYAAELQRIRGFR